MIDAYPLQWPAGKPRTPRHKVERSRFEPGSRPTEVRNITEEIRRLGGRNVVVSTNLRLKADGTPYARDRAPDDVGVAVYFDLNGPKCFACDRWRTIEENLRAIFKSIEAIRGLERWGSKDFVDAAFTGFTALPSPTAKRHWSEVLGPIPPRFGWKGVGHAHSREQIEIAYRARAKECHPDAPGGSHDAMAELNRAKEEALKEIAR